MELKKYLERINYKGPLKTNHETLRGLHLHHLLNIPFENLDIHNNRRIILEPEQLFKKIVTNKRGGFCYEMNGLFYEIISSIGFKAKRISARVYNEKGEAGKEFDHMAVIVRLSDAEWLADVGFGDSFPEPLKMEPGLEQEQYGKIYKILKLEDGDYKVVFSTGNGKFENMYRFSLIPRELKEYQKMCNYHQTSPDSHFTQNRICTLARLNGRITLSGMKFIETVNGAKREIELYGEDVYEQMLKELFGIVI